MWLGIVLFLVAVNALVIVTLVFARKAAERVTELEASKLAKSFETEALAEAEKKKARIADALAQSRQKIEALPDEELQRKVNE